MNAPREIPWGEFAAFLSQFSGDIWPTVAALVSETDWTLARAGDAAARDRIKQKLHGVELYDHLIPIEGDEILVTVQELAVAGILESVTLDCGLSPRAA